MPHHRPSTCSSLPPTLPATSQRAFQLVFAPVQVQKVSFCSLHLSSVGSPLTPNVPSPARSFSSSDLHTTSLRACRIVFAPFPAHNVSFHLSSFIDAHSPRNISHHLRRARSFPLLHHQDHPSPCRSARHAASTRSPTCGADSRASFAHSCHATARAASPPLPRNTPASAGALPRSCLPQSQRRSQRRRR